MTKPDETLELETGVITYWIDNAGEDIEALNGALEAVNDLAKLMGQATLLITVIKSRDEAA